MSNRPYEQDNGVLSTVLGTATLAGVGYGAYYAMTDEEGFQRNLTKIVNTVFPMTTATPNEFQARNIAANNAIMEGERIASVARNTSYAKAAMRRHTDTSAFDVASRMGSEEAAAAYAATSKVGIHDFTDWSHVKGQMGGDTEQSLVRAVNGLTGGLGNDYSFNGTTMEFNSLGRNRPVRLNIPKFNPELGVWLAKENDKTMYVHKQFSVGYKKAEGIRVRTSEKNPIEQVVSTLTKPLELLRILNRDTDTNGYDLRLIDASLGRNEEYFAEGATMADKQKVINGIVGGLRKNKSLFNPNYRSDFMNMSPSEMQDVFDHITHERGRYVAHDEVAKMQFFGNQGKIEELSRVMSNDNFQQLALKEGATAGQDPIGFYRDALTELGYGDSAGWFLNQDMTQQGVFSTISPHTAIGQSEQFKGISKGVKWHGNQAARKTATGRTAPLIRNPDARNVPSHFINDEPVLNLLSIIDATIVPETILLNQEIGNNLKVEGSKTLNMTKLVGRVKDASSGHSSQIEVVWNGEEGKSFTQTFNSLDDFFKHVSSEKIDIKSSLKRINFDKNTVFGFNNGNDIIHGFEEIEMARKLGESGSIVSSPTRGMITPENAAIGRRSWLKSQRDGTQAQITITTIEDTKKISETVAKPRTSVSLLNPDAPMAVAVNPIEDSRLVARRDKIISGLSDYRGKYKAERDKLLDSLEVIEPGIRSSEEAHVRIENEIEEMFVGFRGKDEFAQINTRISNAKNRKLVAQNKIAGLEGWLDNWANGRYGESDRARQTKLAEFYKYKENIQGQIDSASGEIDSLYEQRAAWARDNGDFDWNLHNTKKAQMGELRTQRSRLIRKANGNEDKFNRLDSRVGMYDTQIGNAMSFDVNTAIDARQSWSWFKGTIIKGDKVGKNAPEYLSFLQHSILGHIAYSNNNLTMKVDSDAFKLLDQMAHIPQGIKTEAVNGIVSVKSLVNHPEFRMLQRSTNYGEQVLSAQRMLASIRTGDASRGRVISDEGASKELNKVFAVMDEVQKGVHDRIGEVSGDKAFAYLASYVGNETTSSALGTGWNRFAIGLNEAHLFKGNPSLMREMSMFNSVNTSKIFKQGFRTLESVARKADLSAEGISILNGENAEKLIGKGSHWLENNSSNIGSPEVRMSTMFGDRGISPDGIGVRVLEEDGGVGTRYIGGAEFWGANHYQGEKDIMTKGHDMMGAIDLIRDALGNGSKDAIASKAAREKFDSIMTKIHGNFGKSGFSRTGAIQVETATYDSNVVTHSTLGNSQLMKTLESSKNEAAMDLRYIMGNSVFQSDNLYRSIVQGKLEHMDASRGSKDLLTHVKDAFGAESIVAKALAKHDGNIDKTVNQLSQDSIELSKRMTQVAHDVMHKKKVLDTDIENIKSLIKDIKANADVSIFLRDPVLYPHSAVGAYTFAVDATHIAQDKMLSGGDIISRLMNMDNDGDKIKQFMSMDAASRQKMIQTMNEEQKSSYQTLTAMKDSPLAKPAGHWIDGSGSAFRAVEKGEAGAYEKAVKSIGEVEGATAAYALKALTGSVDVKTHGLVSHILNDAKGKGFNVQEQRELELFVGNTLPLTLVQDAISSKHIARSVETSDSRLLGMLKNVGGITEADFKNNLKASGGDIDVLSFMTITSKLNSAKREDAWVGKGLEHWDTLLALSKNYKTVNEDAYKAAVQHIGYSPDEANTGWGKLAAERLAHPGETPIMERGGAVEKYGFIGFEKLSKGFGEREVKKVQMEYRRLAKLPNQSRSEQELAVDALKNVMTGFGARSSTSIDMLLGTNLASRRSLIGWQTTKNFIKENMLNHPTRMAGIAGLAMVGTTALNMLFGDATPQSPNDLPSVNNPSFRDNRYNNMLENRHLNNAPNANISSGLLTDSRNSYDSIMNHFQSSFGSNYSSVSVRHDGQDPYKEQMMRYNT